MRTRARTINNKTEERQCGALDANTNDVGRRGTTETHKRRAPYQSAVSAVVSAPEEGEGRVAAKTLGRGRVRQPILGGERRHDVDLGVVHVRNQASFLRFVQVQRLQLWHEVGRGDAPAPPSPPLLCPKGARTEGSEHFRGAHPCKSTRQRVSQTLPSPLLFPLLVKVFEVSHISTFLFTPRSIRLMAASSASSGLSNAFKALFTTPFRDFLLTKKNWGDTDQVEIKAEEVRFFCSVWSAELFSNITREQARRCCVVRASLKRLVARDAGSGWMHQTLGVPFIS